MEIIANIDNHPSFSIETWFYRNFRNSMNIPPLHKNAVGGILNNRNLIGATEELLRVTWQTMPGVMSSARSIHGINNVKIVLIYLLKNKNGDKMVLSCLGDERKPPDIMSIGFIGNPDTFKKYLADLSIPEVVIYSKLHHYIED